MKLKSGMLPMVLLLLLPWINGCEKKEKLPELDGYYAVDISGEGLEWDYWVFDEQGHYMLIKEQYGAPTTVFVKPVEEHEGYTVFFDEAGFPSKLVVEDYIFLFDNFNGNMVDVALVYPDGSVEVFREIETQFTLDIYALKGVAETEAWSDVIRWAGHGAALVSCGAGVAGAIASGGVAVPLAVLTCGGFVAGLAAEVWPEDELLGLSAAEVGAVSTYLGCVNPTDLAGKLGCVSGIASTSLTVTSWGVEALERRTDEVRIAGAALQGGYGDIQITLTWDNTADLDLHVVDPSGEEIYWNHDYSASGGYLDYDNITGYGPENVYWEDGEAPAGVYDVYVHHYDWDDAGYPTTSNYRVLINAFGFIRSFSGTTSWDQLIHVASFNQSGLVSSAGRLKSAPAGGGTKVKE